MKLVILKLVSFTLGVVIFTGTMLLVDKAVTPTPLNKGGYSKMKNN